MTSRSRSRITSESGGTLVEVLIAVFILSVVMVGIVGLFAQGDVFVNQIKEHAIVNSALNERMEQIRGMAFSSITGLSSSFTGTGFDQLHNAAGTAAVDDPFSDTNIRRVTLTVSWTSPQGISVTKSLAAYFTSNGVNRK